MPLEPLYSVDVACELIPVTRAALDHILHRRASEFNPPIYHAGGEARYRNGHLVDYDGGAVHRMLTEAECLKVREIVTRSSFERTTPKPAYAGNGRPYGPPAKNPVSRYSTKTLNILLADEVEDVG